MDHVIAKYEKEAYEENAKKLQQVRDNQVPAEQELGEKLVKVEGAASPPGF